MRSEQLRLIGVTLLTCCAMAKEAHAQAPQAPTGKPRDPMVILYEEGIRHYNLAEYDQAIENFKQVYRATAAPQLLFNIAQSYRLKGPGNCTQALRFYTNYLGVEPNSPKRASVDAAISDMEKCAKGEPPPPPEPTPEPAPSKEAAPKAPTDATPVAVRETSPGHSPWIPMVYAGTGLAVAGGALLIWAKLRFDSIESSGCAPACNPDRVSAPRTAQVVGELLLGVGGALTIGGLVWLVGTPSMSRKAFIAPSIGGVRAGVQF